MQLLVVLFFLLFLVAFVAYIVLAIAAFKHSTLWGVLVLLLSPFTAVIFAIKNWEDTKKPFLLYAGSLSGAFLVLVISISAAGGFEMISFANRMFDDDVTDAEVVDFIDGHMDRIEQYGDLSAEDKQQMALMRQSLHQIGQPNSDGNTPGDVSANPTPSTGRESQDWATNSNPIDATIQSRREEPDRSAKVSYDKAHTIIGTFVKIREKAGKVHNGVLLDVKSASLTVERQLSIGTISYEVNRNEIESISVVNQ